MIDALNEIATAIMKSEDPTALIEAAAEKYGIKAQEPSEDELLLSAREANMAEGEQQDKVAKEWLKKAVLLKNSYSSAGSSEIADADVTSSEAL